MKSKKKDVGKNHSRSQCICYVIETLLLDYLEDARAKTDEQREERGLGTYIGGVEQDGGGFIVFRDVGVLHNVKRVAEQRGGDGRTFGAFLVGVVDAVTCQVSEL